jgi:hypothetical protein
MSKNVFLNIPENESALSLALLIYGYTNSNLDIPRVPTPSKSPSNSRILYKKLAKANNILYTFSYVLAWIYNEYHIHYSYCSLIYNNGKQERFKQRPGMLYSSPCYYRNTGVGLRVM